AGPRLGEAEGGDQFASREPGEIARLLIRGAEEQDALHPDRAVRADGERNRAVIARGLRQHACVCGIRQGETAEFLGDDQAEEAEFAQRLDELGRLRALAIPAPEILGLVLEEIVDRFDDLPEYLANATSYRRVGEHC